MRKMASSVSHVLVSGHCKAAPRRRVPPNVQLIRPAGAAKGPTAAFHNGNGGPVPGCKPVAGTVKECVNEAYENSVGSGENGGQEDGRSDEVVAGADVVTPSTEEIPVNGWLTSSAADDQPKRA